MDKVNLKPFFRYRGQFNLKNETARSSLVVTGGCCGGNSSAGGVLRMMSYVTTSKYNIPKNDIRHTSLNDGFFSLHGGGEFPLSGLVFYSTARVSWVIMLQCVC